MIDEPVVISPAAARRRTPAYRTAASRTASRPRSAEQPRSRTQARLGFAARQLHGRDGLLRCREAERSPVALAIERQASARHSRRRNPADSSARSSTRCRAPASSRELGAEAAGPQRHRARHRVLHMRVAGQGASRLARRASSSSAVNDAGRRWGEALDGIAQVQTQRRPEPDRCASGRDARGRRPPRCAP